MRCFHFGTNCGCPCRHGFLFSGILTNNSTCPYDISRHIDLMCYQNCSSYERFVLRISVVGQLFEYSSIPLSMCWRFTRRPYFRQKKKIIQSVRYRISDCRPSRDADYKSIQVLSVLILGHNIITVRLLTV